MEFEQIIKASELPDGDDIIRIAELEAEVAEWKAHAQVLSQAYLYAESRKAHYKYLCAMLMAEKDFPEKS